MVGQEQTRPGTNQATIHYSTRLGELALDRHFGGGCRRHLVTKSLKQEKPKL